MGHRHAIYINVLQGMLMYIACLCPNLVSVHFYAIPILHFKFLIYLLLIDHKTQLVHIKFTIVQKMNDENIKIDSSSHTNNDEMTNHTRHI